MNGDREWLHAFKCQYELCCRSMLGYSGYIEREAKSLKLPDEVLAAFVDLANDLSTPMFDMRSELESVDYLVENDYSRQDMAPILRDIVNRLGEPLARIDQLKRELEARPEKHKGVEQSTFLLMAAGIDLFPKLGAVRALARPIIDAAGESNSGSENSG